MQRISCPSARRGFSSAFIDGSWAPATISLHDLTFIRGDGVFEVVPLLPSPSDRSKGIPVGLSLHLDRMQNTCNSVRLPMLHPAETITSWVRQLGEEKGPGGCRIVFTRGDPAYGVSPRCVMLHFALPPAAAPMTLQSIEAPWHLGCYASPSATDAPPKPGLWTTVKWTSYAPNCLMSRIAAEHGAGDALLLAADGRVLDGPNFAVGFIIAGKVRLVCPRLNRLLPSCTQAMAVAALRDVGIPMEEGVVEFTEVMDRASAAFAMSATRHVAPISAINGQPFATDDELLMSLQDAYWRYIEAELQGM